MWKELFEQSGYLDELAPVNIILLSVIAGIIGLVLSGFTGWHIYLCIKGQTTIEKLEKTRYLSGVRRAVERHRQEQQLNHQRHSSEGVAERLQRAGGQILEFHANAVPGASRYEEGEEHTSPVPSAHNYSRNQPPHHQISNTHPNGRHGNDTNNDTPAILALRRTYSHMEADRERDRYARYLDDEELEKMPNAFDLGWRRNLGHLFGPNPLLWWLPVCNTTGDGWRWEVSPKWMAAQEEVSKRKDQRLAAMMDQNGAVYPGDVNMRGGAGPEGYQEYERDREYSHAYDDNAQRNPRGDVYSRSAMSMKTLPTSDRGRRRQRADIDQSEPNRQVETFQVSSSDEESDDSDSDIGYDDDDVERGWERRNGTRRGRDR